jgi:hypothetical protein
LPTHAAALRTTARRSGARAAWVGVVAARRRWIIATSERKGRHR